MPTIGDERLAISRREAAAILGCSYNHVYKLTEQGKIPIFRVGKLVRIRLSDLDDFMASGGAA